MSVDVIYQVIKRLIGNIHAVGETIGDNIRYNNLKIQCKLLDYLLEDISFESEKKDSPEYSVSRSGKYAYKCLKDIYEWLKEDIDEIS